MYGIKIANSTGDTIFNTNSTSIRLHAVFSGSITTSNTSNIHYFTTLPYIPEIILIGDTYSMYADTQLDEYICAGPLSLLASKVTTSYVAVELTEIMYIELECTVNDFFPIDYIVYVYKTR